MSTVSLNHSFRLLASALAFFGCFALSACGSDGPTPCAVRCGTTCLAQSLCEGVSCSEDGLCDPCTGRCHALASSGNTSGPDNPPGPSEPGDGGVTPSAGTDAGAAAVGDAGSSPTPTPGPCAQLSCDAATTTMCSAGHCLCKPGYAATSNPTRCADIDECAINNGGCSFNATCANTPGGHTCTCKPGYVSDNVTCVDIDECATNNGGCSVNAHCTNTPGSHACSCNPGYTGDGLSCADINECASNNGGCDVNATCTNTPGAHACTCNPGYAGTGALCVDIDECAANVCGADYICYNSPGSYSCYYTGGGGG